MPDGSLEPACLDMLHQVGEWMTINGVGIYGSKAWSVPGEGKDGKLRTLPTGALGKRQADFQFDPEDFRFTLGKDGNLYAFCMSVPPSGTSLVITSLGKNSTQTFQPVTSVELLGYKGKISWKQDMDGLHISLPDTTSNLKIALCFKIATK